MKVRMKIGLESQAYAAPRAEGIELTMNGAMMLGSSVPFENAPDAETEEFEKVVLGGGGL